MKASISPLSIYIIGICLFLICLSYGYSQYAPNAAETKLIKDNTDALNAEGDKKPQATKRVQNALKTVEAKQDEWKGIVETRTPANSVAAGGIDISENGWQLAVDSQKFRNSIQRALNYQLKRGGVTVLSGPEIPFPTESGAAILADFYNYPALSFPVVEFDLGTVEVEGTYKQICDNVRSYSTMPHYLAVVDGLRLDGTSPKLHASYELSLLGYIKGTHLFTAPPELASASSSTGGFGGGGRGGPGGGFGGPGAGRGGPGGVPSAPGGSRAGAGGGAASRGD